MKTLMPQTLLGMDRNLGRFVGELFEDLGVHRQRGGETLSPALDLFETPDAYRLEFELPGVAESNIHVSFEDGLLELTAERSAVERNENEVARYVERRRERFARRVRLPGQVDEQAIRATLKDGVLEVWVPKAAVAQPRRIEVQRSV